MVGEQAKQVGHCLASLAEAVDCAGRCFRGNWLDMTLNEFIIEVMAPNNIRFVYQPPLVEPMVEPSQGTDGREDLRGVHPPIISQSSRLLQPLKRDRSDIELDRQ